VPRQPTRTANQQHRPCTHFQLHEREFHMIPVDGRDPSTGGTKRRLCAGRVSGRVWHTAATRSPTPARIAGNPSQVTAYRVSQGTGCERGDTVRTARAWRRGLHDSHARQPIESLERYQARAWSTSSFPLLRYCASLLACRVLNQHERSQALFRPTTT